MSLAETIYRTMFVKPHPAGYPFIGGALALAIVLLLIWKPLGIAGLFLTAAVYYFFRDPVRMVPQRDGLVVSPADGRVISVTPHQSLPDDLSEEDENATYTKISIFLSVLDAHVNRTPIGGEIVKTFYYEGKFLNAELDKASEENERASALVKLENGKLLGFTQIAGLVARRIVTNLEAGQKLETGERFGLIRFGSRMDVYLPEGVNSLVCVGQRALAGETILADLNSKEKQRMAKAI
ncbi:MAG: phosphatidylserine decarboxylase [Alphaproteobacteria bacterium]|nr:phosphatidylserine decarboxylase [Alphaproteobacteria bacterium]